jgi:Domain of unknown function (DUF4148)
MKSNIKLMLATITAATAGLFASPAVLAESMVRYGENAGMPEQGNFVSTKSRAEVRAEAIAATRAGTTARSDGEIERELTAGFQSEKTRAQVVAETREARRLGLMDYRYESEPVVATAEQLRLIAQAGERANAERMAGR